MERVADGGRGGRRRCRATKRDKKGKAHRDRPNGLGSRGCVAPGPCVLDHRERHDGIDVRDQSLENVWSEIGFVPQRAFLIGGTIASNLKYGKADASDEELWEALTVAQADEFVKEKEDGLNSPVSQGGTNFSGGQRQRLSIARAIVKKPQIYILDDSFSALDYSTDAKLRVALEEHAKNSTLIVVAQRVSTILKADQIVVLNNGKIDGIGNHADLMKSCKTYQEIVLSQLSPEEAAS